MLEFEAVFSGSHGLFSVPHILKRLTFPFAEGPTEGQDPRLQALDAHGLCGLLGMVVDASLAPAAGVRPGLQLPKGCTARLRAPPLREDGPGAAWTATPDRLRAPLLREDREAREARPTRRGACGGGHGWRHGQRGEGARGGATNGGGREASQGLPLLSPRALWVSAGPRVP